MVIDNPYEGKPQDNNSRVDWWNNVAHKLHYAEYQVGGTTVYIGVRPDYYGTNQEFYRSVGGWINVSDRFVRHDKNVTNMFAPWNEGGQPQIETIFTILKTLDYWIREQKLNRVYVACDGGTHRAVTMFGFYLLAYHKEEAEAINNAHVLVGRPDWSNPLEYARGYIKENKIPGIQLILDNIKSSASGSYTHGDSLEDFLKNHISKEFLEQYYRERFMDYTLKTYWYWLKYEIKYFFTGTLWSNPKARIKIYVHKKLNTKLGQWYKRNNF